MDHDEAAEARRDPPASRKADERRATVTDDRGGGRKDLERQPSAGDDRDEDSNHPFEDIQHARDDGGTGPQRAEDIRPACPAAADRARVGTAGETGDYDAPRDPADQDRKSTRLNSSHTVISYAVF